MDDWRNRLTDQLLGPAGKQEPAKLDSATALEIVLGQARSEITYLLELGRTHRLPVTGSVNSDDVWVRVGATLLRFAYSRRAGVIVASVVGREDQQLRFSPEKNAVVMPEGEVLDAPRYIREAIDATVGAWRAAGKPDLAISSLRERGPLPTIPDDNLPKP